MIRRNQGEILDQDGVPDELVERAYRDIARIPMYVRLNAEDGRRSIRRSFTPAELRGITTSALAGTGGTFRLSVAAFHARQVVDISYAHVPSWEGGRKE